MSSNLYRDVDHTIAWSWLRKEQGYIYIINALLLSNTIDDKLNSSNRNMASGVIFAIPIIPNEMNIVLRKQ